MKRNLLLLLCILMLMTLIGCSNEKTASSSKPILSQPTSSSSSKTNSSDTSSITDEYSSITYKISEEADKFYVNGRTMEITTSAASAPTEKGMLFDHAGQGLLFTADCEGDVSVELAVISEGNEGTDHQLFSVRVDGVSTTVTVDSGATETVITIPLAKGLSRGKHSFALYRCNEPMLGRATLLTVKMTGRAEKYTAPEEQLKIIFLGDSITAGHGTRAKNGDPEQYYNKCRDATLSYAFLCGEALNADFHLIARSSMATTANESSKRSANYYYNYYSYERPESERVIYDVCDEDVDVYVISLGTNDHGWIRDLVKSNAKALIQRVREDYPNAKIVWTYGQMADTYKDVYKAAVEELGGADANLYFYLYNEPNRDGGSTHPSAEAHAIHAKELAQFIRSIL